MERSDVARLFAYACFYDGRLQADEGKILAWGEALDSRMTLDWARKFVIGFYSINNKTMVTPADFNLEFYREMREKRDKDHSRQIQEEFEENEKRKATPERIRQIREQYFPKREGEANDNTAE